MRHLLPLLFFLLCLPLFGQAADFPEAGKVCLLNLSEDNCIPCKLMNKMVAKMQAEYQGKIAALTVDALQDRAAAAKYKARILPTLIFFSADGAEARRHVGFMGESALRAQIDLLLAD